jgi:predicted anti-sigma-YlaC factor YlaD
MTHLTCKEVIAFLMDYLDGTVDAEERERFDWHLARCHSCVAYLRTYQTTLRMAQACRVDTEDVPDELVEAILAARHVGEGW